MEGREPRVGHSARAHRATVPRGRTDGLEGDLDIAVTHREPLARVLRSTARASLQCVQVTDYVFVTRTVQTVPPLLAYSVGPMLCQRSQRTQVPLFSGTV